MSELTNRLISYLSGKQVNNAASLSREINISHTAASNYFNHKRDPKTEVLSLIKQRWDDLDLNWLFNGLDIPGNSSVKKNNTLPYVITVDTQGRENVVMVQVTAQAGYLNGYDDPDFLSDLPSYRLPKVDNGTYRMFEVKGHSMYPTIHSGAIAVGEWCENWEQEIKDNHIYILVTKEEGIIIKRCLNRINKYGNIYAKSDNRREYPSFQVHTDQLVEVWKLKTAMIFDFQDPATIYDRISDLEAKWMQMKHTQDKL